MDKKLDLSLKLPLHEMALRRAAVNLWNEYDMSAVARSSIASFRIGKEVKERISKLKLPETLKKRMTGFVLPVQYQIMKFKSLHEFIFDEVPPEEFNLRIWRQVCWTSKGDIDHRKTAEELVRLQIIDVGKRYRLACSYCLEDYIPVLWEELPESYKSRFEGEIYPLPENVEYLEYYWAFVMKGEELKLDDVLPREFTHASSTYQSYFTYSACVVTRAATEYFLQKLTDEERNSALCHTFGKTCDAFRRVFCAPRGTHSVHNGGLGNRRSDVLYYLLSLMTHEQQMQVLRNRYYECLLCFQDWPWPAFFLDIADLTWSFIPESQYGSLFKLAFTYFSLYDVPELFQKFFMRSPSNFRKRFADIVSGYPVVLSYFFQRGDAETIRVVLENLDYGEKMKVLSSPHFFKSLCLGKWYLVELCVGQDALSKEDRNVLKDIYEGFRTETMEGMDFNLSEIKWKQLSDVLDGTNVSTSSPKCSENEDLTETKIICWEEGDCDSNKKMKIR